MGNLSLEDARLNFKAHRLLYVADNLVQTEGQPGSMVWKLNVELAEIPRDC